MYLLKCPFFVCCAILPLETLPPGDPSGGVVYLRIVLFPKETSQLMNITMIIIIVTIIIIISEFQIPFF
jgi:hypothetical protein